MGVVVLLQSITGVRVRELVVVLTPGPVCLLMFCLFFRHIPVVRTHHGVFLSCSLSHHSDTCAQQQKEVQQFTEKSGAVRIGFYTNIFTCVLDLKVEYLYILLFVYMPV